MLFVFPPNKTCRECQEVILGAVKIEEDGHSVLLCGCREINCPHVEKERPTVWRTPEGEKIIARKLRD